MCGFGYFIHNDTKTPLSMSLLLDERVTQELEKLTLGHNVVLIFVYRKYS